MSCELCEGVGGELIWTSPKLRIVKVDDPLHSSFYRVIWTHHVKEMTDLSEADRMLFMTAVFTLETVLRDVLRPLKINLASLGNVTPHLHWHVIARFESDPHYPAPVWATPRHSHKIERPLTDVEAIRAQLIERLGHSSL